MYAHTSSLFLRLPRRVLRATGLTEMLCCPRIVRVQASKVVLARDIDVAFKSATRKEIREMAKDEACPICLKAMLSAKK